MKRKIKWSSAANRKGMRGIRVVYKILWRVLWLEMPTNKGPVNNHMGMMTFGGEIEGKPGNNNAQKNTKRRERQITEIRTDVRRLRKRFKTEDEEAALQEVGED